jgi:putative DNA primase/helicase
MNNPTAPRPVALPISPDRIPSDLKTASQFVGWRYEWRVDQWTKPPICIQTGEHASSTDLGTCTTYELAVLAYRNNTHELAGIGYVLVEDNHIVGFDFDHCRNPDTGEIDPWALELIRRLDSYTEVSPSGCGIRVWTYGTFVDEKQGRKSGDVEMYRGQRYLTLTGCHLEGTPTTIERRQEAIDAIYDQFFRRVERPPGKPHTNGHTPSLDDTALLEKALNARNGGKLARLLAGDIRGYPSASEADLALCSMLAFWTQDAEQIDRLVCGSELFRDKWERADYRNATIAQAISQVRERWRGPAGTSTNSHAGGNDNHSEGTRPSSDNEGNIHLTDVGNGLRLVKQFGHDLRYVITWEKWLTWRDYRWQLDTGKLVEWHAKQVIGGLYRWAEQKLQSVSETLGQTDSLVSDERAARTKEFQVATDVLKWAHASENGSHIDTMVKRARVNPIVQVRHDALDADPWLFQVINGTIDLRTGQLLTPHRARLITKCAGVAFDPGAECPTWLASLRRWQGYPTEDEVDDALERDRRIRQADAMMLYLQRLVGISLTGMVTVQILPFLYGLGRNGKSTFLNTILALMGEYGMQAPPNFLLIRDREPHPTEQADLFGKRFVSTIEVEKGKYLAESLMKTLTGGEHIRARRMREDFWEFAPTWKIWLAANDKPRIRGRELATWRRIKLIPFNVQIPEEEINPELPEKLKAELPGILNWAIEGCLDWQRLGKLPEPQIVTDATIAYREESDLLTQFVTDCCQTGSFAKVQSKPLHQAYEHYTGQSITAVEFSELMKSAGYAKKLIGGKTYWLGLGLITFDNSAQSAPGA